MLLLRTFRISPFFFQFYWSTVDWHHCVSFRCIAKWLGYTRYIHCFVAQPPASVSNPRFLTECWLRICIPLRVLQALLPWDPSGGAPCATLAPSPSTALTRAPLRALAFEESPAVTGALLRAPSHPYGLLCSTFSSAQNDSRGHRCPRVPAGLWPSSAVPRSLPATLRKLQARGEAALVLLSMGCVPRYLKTLPLLSLLVFS